MPGSTLEREALRAIDDERAIEKAVLRETADDRRRANARHWGRKLGVYTQQYERHPARSRAVMPTLLTRKAVKRCVTLVVPSIGTCRTNAVLARLQGDHDLPHGRHACRDPA
jgi:hypothetical protein